MNKEIIDQFKKLVSQIQHEIETAKTDKDKDTNTFRLKNIVKGLKIIQKFPTEIKTSRDLDGVPGIGKGIKARIDEILEKGKLKEVKLSKKTEKRLDEIGELKEVL